MLDLRLYRAAFVPVLLVLLVVAFSLTTRPRPIGTTLATDTFSGAQALSTLDRLTAQFPDRRPGSRADRAMAAAIAAELRRTVPGSVTTSTAGGRTIDGVRDLTTVTATRPGAPGPEIVVVAHRDSAGSPARAELSGTAALLELARVAGAGRLQRTITFLSTSGGSGGFAGAVEAASRLGRPVDAVIVLGAVGAAGSYQPIVSGVSNGPGQAPLQLTRTVREAVAAESGLRSGAPGAFIQGLRMAAPMTTGEQGPFLRAGLPAVLVSATGERVPSPGAAISPRRLEGVGRGVLRALYALDNGPDISGDGPTQALVMRGKVLPAWAVRLLVLALLLPALLVAVDGLARLRRRRERLLPWVAWGLAPALALAVTAVVAVALAKVRLLAAAPPAPVPPGALQASAGAVVAGLVLLATAGLGWAALRPLVLRAAGMTTGTRPDPPAAGVVAGAAVPFAAFALWFLNPYAAGAMVPAAHLWLWATAPDIRAARRVRAGLILAGCAVPLMVVAVLAQILGLGVQQVPWFWTLLIAGGHVPWWSWLAWSVFWGGAVTSLLVVFRRTRVPDTPEQITIRGPRSYAGPGSIGGTTSALRR